MKIACIYHSIDLDGWMSAAIVKYWSNQPAKEGEHICGIFDYIGYNHGDPIPDLSKYDKIIMCDISFPKEEMKKINDRFFDNNNFIWIDHHISSIKDNEDLIGLFGIRDINYAACELTWKYFFPEKQMPEIVRLLGIYDSFRHIGTEEEEYIAMYQCGAKHIIRNVERTYSWLESAVTCADESNDIYAILRQGEIIYEYLYQEAKQIYKTGFEIDYFEDSKGEKTIGEEHKRILCFNKSNFNPFAFGIDCRKDGYDAIATFSYHTDNKWIFTLYAGNNNDIDCSVIAKKYGGGGHKGAAGFSMNNEQFFNFMQTHLL